MRFALKAAAAAIVIGTLFGLGTARHGHARAAEPPAFGQRAFPRGFPRDPEFFPIGVWLQQPMNAAEFAAMGVNTYVGLFRPPTSADLAALKQHGMLLVTEQTPEALALVDSPVLRAWMQVDEPDNAQPGGMGVFGACVSPEELARRYRAIKAADPTRPIYVGFGQAVANPRWVGRGACSRIPPEDYYPAASSAADIAGFDIYPAADARGDVAGRLELVGEGVGNLRRWTKPDQQVWNTIETTHINNPSRRATPSEIRSEAWMSLIRGSTGIIYFVHEWRPSFREDGIMRYPETVQTVARLNAQIKKLAPVLNSPTLPDCATVATPAKVDVMVKRYGDDFYLFAANMENKPAHVRFTICGAGAGDAIVIDEERSVKADGGVIEDEFAGYSVHLYQLRAAK